MTWTISKASIEFGTTRETIRRGLLRVDIDAKKKSFTTKEITAAVFGDLKFERTRRERAEADAIERDNRKADNEIIPHDDVRRFIGAVFNPMREQLISMPASLSARVNPEKPQVARETLQGWVDALLAQAKQNQPKELE